MGILLIVLQVIMLITSAFLVLLILLHKGKGGGLADMFGGGIAQSASSSGVAERNLNRITIGFSVVWFVSIVLVGLLQKFGY